MKKFIWRLFQLGVGIFLAFHVYAFVLKFAPVPTTALMVKRGFQGEDIRRDWTRLEDISPYMVQAVLGGEDGRFCEHKGIDFEAIEKAMEDNEDGGRRRGGSTITQQTAKNVFFWNGGGYVRKAGEAWMASFIDFIWGKRRTMEVYLNVAEWGDGIFGVEQAAQVRFGKSAANLTAQEAALLASVLPSPHKWRVDPPGPYVQRRAVTLRQRMRVIETSQYDSCVNGKSPPPKRKTVPKKKAPEVKKPEIKDPEPVVPKGVERETVEPEVIIPENEVKPVQSEVVAPETEPGDTIEPNISVPETEPADRPAPESEQTISIAPESEIASPEPEEIETEVLPEVDLMEMDSGDKSPEPEGKDPQ